MQKNVYIANSHHVENFLTRHVRQLVNSMSATREYKKIVCSNVINGNIDIINLFSEWRRKNGKKIASYFFRPGSTSSSINQHTPMLIRDLFPFFLVILFMLQSTLVLAIIMFSLSNSLHCASFTVFIIPLVSLPAHF